MVEKWPSHSWHSRSVEEVIELTDSDAYVGLSFIEAQHRLIKYGPNTLPSVRKKTWLGLFLSQFKSPLIYILFVAAIIAFFVGEIKDAIIILIVVTLNSIIGSVQEGRSEHSLDALKKLTQIKTRVIREGEEIIIPSSEVVPGDLLTFGAGDAIPTDARLIKVSSLQINEASLTGESIPVTKLFSSCPENSPLSERNNMIYAGTFVAAGRGVAIATATGLDNEVGKIASLSSEVEQPKTQLEIRVQKFGQVLIYISLLIFVLIIGIGLWRQIPIAQIFMIAISQMVSLVPEGLPVAITIALTVGVQRMAERGTVVRRLSAVESLGSTTVICADKTGTLTKNEMTVRSLYLSGDKKEITVTGAGYSPQGKLFDEEGQEIILSENVSLKKLTEICVLCNDAQYQSEKLNLQNGQIVGDPTEVALLVLAAKVGINAGELRKQISRKDELPFDPDFKLMATEHFVDGEKIIYIKGAPDVLIPMCSRALLKESEQELGYERRTEILHVSREMASRALRVLAFAYVKGPSIDHQNGFSALDQKLIFVGLVGEMDPPREEASDSVLQCQRAGIKPIMVTGDHKTTGLAIAKSIGIFREGELSLDGQELDKMPQEVLLNEIDQVKVFARVRPDQKLRIIEAYQKKGQVVAMTGDGVNDAPALVRANVGVAMGVTGTEVAKEAAKIVIMDDNFSTIVKAIEEGRLVYQNIKKLLLFLIVTSIDEVVILLLALLLDYPLPLAAVQILWINLVTEGALTVNLIMEPAEGNEMQRPPISPDQPLLDRELLSRVPLLFIASVTTTFFWFVYRHSMDIPLSLLQTETFTLLTINQWFNVLNCRSSIQSVFSLQPFKNTWLMGGLFLAVILQIMVIYWRPLGQFFHTEPIEFGVFVQILGLGGFVLIAEEIRKFLVRRKL